MFNNEIALIGEAVTVKEIDIKGNVITSPNGHALVGWNTEKDGSGTSYAVGDSITLNGKTTVLYAQWEEATKCDHRCHKGGIVGFFWKITNFLNKIFGINRVCKCGVNHY